MYVPKARKLPSGNWQCRVTIEQGMPPVSITRPTRKEAEREAAALKSGAKDAPLSDMTVREAIDSYIRTKEHILSPSTIRSYRSIERNRLQTMMHRKIASITQAQWQSAINQESKEVSPKTVKNVWRFMSSVISETTGSTIKVLLPQRVPFRRPWLRPDEINTFMSVIRGTFFEIPALLALHSLRLSEVLAMTWDKIDLEHDVIHVRGAVVPQDGGELIYKVVNKTESSNRDIPFILPQLREAVEKADKTKPIVTCHPTSLNRAISRVCKANGLPGVGMHGLRKSFASLATYKRIPKEYIMEIGGWSTSDTLDKVYVEVWGEDLKKSLRDYEDLFQ